MMLIVISLLYLLRSTSDGAILNAQPAEVSKVNDWNPTASSFSFNLIDVDGDDSPIRRKFRSISQKMNSYLIRGYQRLAVFDSRLSNINPKKSLVHPTADNTYNISINVQGVVYEIGGHILELSIGNPQKSQLLLFDTGSELSWVQCSNCAPCYKQLSTRYSYSSSKTALYYPCNTDKDCSLSDTITSCSSSNSCIFQAIYSGSISSGGILINDTFTFNTISKSKVSLRTQFGCSLFTDGVDNFADGFAGFGRGPSSLPSQYKYKFGRNSFSSCLVRNYLNSKSKLLMGTAAISHTGVNYTALLTNPYIKTQNYFVDVTDVYIAEKKLNIPSWVWKFNRTQPYGGSLLDSSSTLTFLFKPAFDVIIAQLKKYMQGRLPLVPNIKGFSPCYKLSLFDQLILLDYFPVITFTFRGGVKVRQLGYHYIAPFTQNVVCSIFQPTNKLSMFGHFFQQNLLVVYDIHGGRIGFKPMDCAKGKPTS